MNYRIENLIDRKTVENRIKELAKQIEKDYAGEEVYCVGLLKGSVVFLSDLVKDEKLERIGRNRYKILDKEFFEI